MKKLKKRVSDPEVKSYYGYDEKSGKLLAEIESLCCFFELKHWGSDYSNSMGVYITPCHAKKAYEDFAGKNHLMVWKELKSCKK